MEEIKEHIIYTPLNIKCYNGCLTRLNWDIVVQGTEYFGYHLGPDFDNYDESEKEHYSERDDTWFICRRDCPENEITDNLIRVSRDDIGVRWGFRIKENSYIKCKWDDEFFRTNVPYVITRNDEDFIEGRSNSLENAYIRVMSTINDLKDAPIPVSIGEIDWDKNLIGAKVWFDDQPAIVQSVYKSEVWLVPDKEYLEKFKTPESWKDEAWMDYSEYENGLYVEIISPSIRWFRK